VFQRPPPNPATRRTRPACAAACVLVVIGALSAGPGMANTVYRWQDAQGNIVLSDRPPVDRTIKFETIESGEKRLRFPGARDTGAEGAPESRPARSEAESPAAQDPAPGGGASLEVTPDPEVCRQARDNLDILDTKPRIRVYGDDGELRYLTPGETQARRERTLLLIDLHCRD